MEGKTATEAEEKNTAHYLWKVIMWRVGPTNMLLNLKGFLLSRYVSHIRDFFFTFSGPYIVIYLRNKDQQDALLLFNLFK